MNDIHTERRRFWSRVKADNSGHWLWVGGLRDNGYGMFAVRKPDGRWTQTTAQRFAYQDLKGSIPDGYEVDHLCRVRHCVRPEHLEAITVEENRKRRDRKVIFNVPLDFKPLPIIPSKPTPPPKIDRSKYCLNGHEYAIAGKIPNGKGRTGKAIFTCAECRRIQSVKKRNGNAAKNRKSCPKGHPYSGENLITRTKVKNGNPYTARECRACTRKGFTL
jgi:hypothetical protein